MRVRSTFRLAVAEIAAVAINIIPLAMWYFDDLSAKAAMLIYAFEALFAVVFRYSACFSSPHPTILKARRNISEREN